MNKNNFATIPFTTFRRARATKPLMQCRVCEAPAMYSYVSVISCPSCKMFFKRHAESAQKPLRCLFDGHCHVNISTRRACAYCRWKKCLASGMQVEMLRGSTSRNQQTNQSQQLPILDLLQSDRSTLTRNDWTLLSNLLHCFDEYSGFFLTNQFLVEQHALPLKMRFKTASVDALTNAFLFSSQTLFERNADFRSLCSHDRSVLLRSTMKHTSGLGAVFLWNNASFCSYPAFCQSAEAIYGSMAFRSSVRAARALDPDHTFVKLALASLIFSTLGHEDDINQPPMILKDTKAVVRIQDAYIELAWCYLLYKYDLRRAVSCFSNLIRSLLSLNAAISSAIKVDTYNQTIDSLLKQTEEILVITD